MFQTPLASRLIVLLTAFVEGALLWRAMRRSQSLALPSARTRREDRDARQAVRQSDDADEIKRAWQALWRKLDERDRDQS